VMGNPMVVKPGYYEKKCREVGDVEKI